MTTTSVMDLFDLPEDDKGYDALPEGMHTAEIEEATLDEANKWGPRVSYTLRVTGETAKNRKIWVHRKLSPTTMWKIRNDLDALGYQAISSKNIESILSELPGKTVEVEVGYAPNPKNDKKPYMNVEFMTEKVPF